MPNKNHRTWVVSSDKAVSRRLNHYYQHISLVVTCLRSDDPVAGIDERLKVLWISTTFESCVTTIMDEVGMQTELEDAMLKRHLVPVLNATLVIYASADPRRQDQGRTRRTWRPSKEH